MSAVITHTLAYALVEWDVILESNGDIFDKILVRIREMSESIRIIRQCLAQLQVVKGPVDSNPKEIKAWRGNWPLRGTTRRGVSLHPKRRQQSTRSSQNPRSQLHEHHHQSGGGDRGVDRRRIDHPGSVDPCYCCTERMAAVIDPRTEATLIPAKIYCV